MKEELLKELQKRLRKVIEQAQLEMNKYHLESLIGKIEAFNEVIGLIKQIEL